MAMIRCPECGQEISDKAEKCIHCGCPLNAMDVAGEVRIKLPNDVVYGWAGLFSSRKAEITDAQGQSLWRGEHGENARFKIDKPTKITIDLGRWANMLTGTVCPRRKYTLVQDLGVHMLATYRLTEVDVIDAD